MHHQRFFPRNRADKPRWYGNFAHALEQHGLTLGLPPAEVADIVADALYLEYCFGPYLAGLRTFGPAATGALREIAKGGGSDPLPMPGFAPSPLPGASGPLPAVVPVAPGAHARIMRFVQLIKLRPTYTQATGVQLGIVGAGEAAARAMPSFTLEVETGLKGQQVRLRFKKFGHRGVAIYGRRGGGDWESLGIDTASPFTDKRPLLVPGQPETRDYRLRFYDDDVATGEYTPIASVIVGA